MVREILVCPPGTIPAPVAHKLLKHGIFVVEARDPDKVRLLRAQETVGAGDLLWAALSAMQHPEGVTGYGAGSGEREVRARFAARLFELVDAEHQQRHQKAEKE